MTITPAERAAIRAEAFREAAEIARNFPRVLYDEDGGRDSDGCDIADAIEARAGEKAKE